MNEIKKIISVKEKKGNKVFYYNKLKFLHMVWLPLFWSTK